MSTLWLIGLPSSAIFLLLALVGLAIADSRNCKLKAIHACEDARSWVLWRVHWSDERLWRACPPEWKLWYLTRTLDAHDPLFRATLCDLLALMPESDLRGSLITGIQKRLYLSGDTRTDSFLQVCVERVLHTGCRIDAAKSAMFLAKHMVVDHKVRDSVIHAVILARYPKPPYPEDPYVHG